MRWLDIRIFARIGQGVKVETATAGAWMLFSVVFPTPVHFWVAAREFSLDGNRWIGPPGIPRRALFGLLAKIHVFASTLMLGTDELHH